MTADTDRTVLDDAWGYIPQAREGAPRLGSFTRRRVERIITVTAGMGSIALGVQAFFAALAPGDVQEAWNIPLMLAVFLPLAAMILACLIGRGVVLCAGAFAVIYIIVLALWPFVTTDAPTTGGQPWVWYLVNVATLAAVLAFALPLQVMWTILAPVLYGVVQMILTDFSRDFWIPTALDVSFALILGGVLLTLGWMFRSVAAGVDETRSRAVTSYAQAAAVEASEQERVAVAALMHDSVLAALIAVERATTPRERTLAVAMAREALTRLANAERDSGEGSDAPEEVGSIADAIARAADEFGVDMELGRRIDPEVAPVPGRVARALELAATQAIANAVEHADSIGLGVIVEADAATSTVRIAVRDAGGGFDLDGVPDDRLGIRASIIARVAAVGGSTQITSTSHGTTVSIEWKHPPA